jgi:hypothetical protein
VLPGAWRARRATGLSHQSHSKARHSAACLDRAPRAGAQVAERDGCRQRAGRPDASPGRLFAWALLTADEARRIAETAMAS